MKVDYFAEFRRPPIENEGNMGTNPEKGRETKEFSTGAGVPHDLEGRGTGEQTMNPEATAELSNLFPCSPSHHKSGEQPATLKVEEKQGVFQSVPRVPHVPRKNTEGGEEGSARELITPDSRHPLIPPQVRGKIESVEADARAKGWPAELPRSEPVIGERWLNAARLGREDDGREDEVDRLARNDGWRPLAEIPRVIAAEIKRIEPQALALGWSPRRLWNFEFWPHTRLEPRGLASVINEGDRIVEVYDDHLIIEKADDGRHTRQTFWKCES